MAKSIAIPENIIDLELLQHYDKRIKERVGVCIAVAKKEVEESIGESIEGKVDEAIGEKLEGGVIQEKVTETVETVIGEKIKSATNADIDNMFEAVKVNIRPMDDEDAEVELGGVKLGDLVGDGFAVALSDNQITATGTLEKVEGWEAFPEESQVTDYYIPLVLTSPDGDVLKVDLLGGGTKESVFGATGDGPGTIRLVLAVKESEPTRTMTVYGSQEDAEQDRDGRIIKVDASGCAFGE